MRFKVVLFDLDGTLVDSLPLILESFRATMKQMNLPYNKNNILKTIGLPLIDICRQFAGEKGTELFNRYLEHQNTIHDLYLKEYAGTKKMLQELKDKNHLLGIVTSKRRVMAEKGIKLTGFDHFIDVLVGLEDSPRPKPGAEPVLTALQALNKMPEETVYVGDSPFDMRCGNQANVHTIGVTWGISSREQLKKENPDLIISNWQQLLDYIDSP